MVAQDNGSCVTQRLGDSSTRLEALNLNFFIVEQRVIFEENTGLLGNRLQQTSFRGKGCTPACVHMYRANSIGARCQDRLVNIVTGNIHSTFTLYQRAVRADQHQIGDLRCMIRNAVPQHPKTVSTLRIASTDVTIAQIAPALSGQQSIAQGTVSLTPRTHLSWCKFAFLLGQLLGARHLRTPRHGWHACGDLHPGLLAVTPDMKSWRKIISIVQGARLEEHHFVLTGDQGIDG